MDCMSVICVPRAKVEGRAGNKVAEKIAPTHLLRHMIKEDAEDAPAAVFCWPFCAFAPFLFAIRML